MTSSKLNLTLVGGFVLAGMVTLVAVLALLAGRTGATDAYYTVYESVPGLKFGSRVLFQGYQVGQVDKVLPFDDAGRTRFRVELLVSRGWKIPQDSVARSEASGILAPQTIYISAGQSTTMLEPGAMIPPAQAANLMASVGDMARNANVIMASAVMELPAILKQVNKTAVDLDRFVNNADGAVDSLGKSAHNLEKFVQTGAPELLTTMREMRLTMESLSRHSESFSQNMESTSGNLQEFSRQIRQNPGVLLRSPEMQDDPGSALKRGSSR